MSTVRIGMVGVWGRAYFLKDYLHRPSDGESAVVAGADVSDFALGEFKKWAGEAAFATKDYRELLSRDDVDLVTVVTPDWLHEEHAVAALEAGKHVYLEKPMAISVEGCDRILRAAKRSGRKLMVGFELRYNPLLEKAKSLVDEGRIGDVKAVWMRHFVGAGGDFYYHDWHSLKKNVNSLILQKGSHDLDLMHWLAGSYAESVAAFGDLDYFGGDKPNELTCDACPEYATCPEAQPLIDRLGLRFPRLQCAWRQEVDVEDNQVMILRLRNGVKGCYLQCHFSPEYQRNYAVIGTTGRLEINLDTSGLTLIPRRIGQSCQHPPDVETFEVTPGDNDEYSHGGADPGMVRALLDYVLRDVPPKVTPLDGRMSVAAACAAVTSLREGGVQQVFLPSV